MAKKNIEDLLGKEEETKNPLEATPDGEGEENVLEKMDQISKAKPQKESKSSNNLDDDVLKEMFKTGENTDGMFTPDLKEEEKEDLHEDEDEKAELEVGKTVNPKGKYENNLKNDMLKHPDDYKVMTPKGEMTVSEAIRAGYDPTTKTFKKEHDQEAMKEKYLGSLNDADRSAIESLTSPSAAQVAPADAGMYGLNENSPMIKKPMPEGNPMMPEANPMMTPQAPVGSPLPGAEESAAPGGQDLSALLGGNA